MRSRALSLFVAVAALVGVAGCGPSRPAVAPVSGAISYGGTPVTTGVIYFYPEKGRPATSLISRDGTYTLGTFTQADGALMGSHRVVIESRITSPAAPRRTLSTPALPPDAPEALRREMADGLLTQAGDELNWLVPEMYAGVATTPLRANVAPGRNTIDFALPAP